MINECKECRGTGHRGLRAWGLALALGVIGGHGAQATETQPARSAVPPAAVRIGILLPTEDRLLGRAAQAVRQGIERALRVEDGRAELVDCAYGGAVSVLSAYGRCIEAQVQWIIGPLGRAEVATLLAKPLERVRPTLMLSPLGAPPPKPFFTVAPDLESEAETIAERVLQDGCRGTLLLEGAGPMATRIAVAVTAWWREASAQPLRTLTIPPRSQWQRRAAEWRAEGIDCIIFAGSAQTLSELRPFLRGMALYVTTASYENALDRVADWTGVRIADAPFVLEAESPHWERYAAEDVTSPTLLRLRALGVDAARLVLAAEGEQLPLRFEGAIGRLELRERQYRRTPAIGEFRERRLVRLGP